MSFQGITFQKGWKPTLSVFKKTVKAHRPDADEAEIEKYFNESISPNAADKKKSSRSKSKKG